MCNRLQKAADVPPFFVFVGNKFSRLRREREGSEARLVVVRQCIVCRLHYVCRPEAVAAEHGNT